MPDSAHSPPPRVFLDTLALSYAAKTKVDQRLDSKHSTIRSKTGELKYEGPLLWGSNNPRKPKPVHPDLAKQIEALSRIAHFAHQGALELLYSHEVNLELLFQPRVNVAPGLFFGAPLTLVPTPFDYRNGTPRWPDETPTSGAAIPGPLGIAPQFIAEIRNNPQRLPELVAQFLVRLPDRGVFLHEEFRSFIVQLRTEFKPIPTAAEVLRPLLARLKHARYQEILHALDSAKASTLLDALLLLTAEEHDSIHFLTTDRRILDRYKHDSVQAIRPTRLARLVATM